LDFERTLAASRAVISRPIAEVQRLAHNDKQLYATYYQLLEAGVQLPNGSKWDVLRAVADAALFSGYKENIRFGALTLDGRGVEHYGECHLLLRDDMISHRATAFEENSTVWMKNHKIKMAHAHRLPKGYRATWDERAKLGIAKLGSRIASTTTAGDFPSLLIKQGNSASKDEFIEVHVCGPLTIRTFDAATLSRPASRVKRIIQRAVEIELKKAGVTVSSP
jgi:hypothetical protein